MILFGIYPSVSLLPIVRPYRYGRANGVLVYVFWPVGRWALPPVEFSNN